MRLLARLCLGYLLAVPTLLLYSPPALRIPAGCLMLVLFCRDMRAWRRGPLPAHWKRLVSLSCGQWCALTHGNGHVPLELVRAATVTPGVIRLDLRSPHGRLCITLGRDTLPAPLHRRLRVRLRWHEPAREFAGRIRSQSGT